MLVFTHNLTKGTWYCTVYDLYFYRNVAYLKYVIVYEIVKRITLKSFYYIFICIRGLYPSFYFRETNNTKCLSYTWNVMKNITSSASRVMNKTVNYRKMFQKLFYFVLFQTSWFKPWMEFYLFTLIYIYINHFHRVYLKPNYKCSIKPVYITVSILYFYIWLLIFFIWYLLLFWYFFCFKNAFISI